METTRLFGLKMPAFARVIIECVGWIGLGEYGGSKAGVEDIDVVIYESIGGLIGCKVLSEREATGWEMDIIRGEVTGCKGDKDIDKFGEARFEWSELKLEDDLSLFRTKRGCSIVAEEMWSKEL